MALISELNEKNTINDSDYMIIEDNENTQKIRLATLLKDTAVGMNINENGSISLVRKDGTPIGDSIVIPNVGKSSKDIEMTFDGVFVKWKYKDESVWENLFSIDQIIGTNEGGSASDIYLSIGTVTTLTSGENATASIEKLEDNNFILNIGIPKADSIVINNDGVQVPPQITKVVNKSTSTALVSLANNTEYIFGTLENLNIIADSTTCSNTDFNAKLYFRSKDTSLMNFNQSTYIHFVGDDCVLGALIPNLSTDYRIEFYYGGQRLIGKVYAIHYGGIASLSDFANASSIVNVAKSYVDNMRYLIYGTDTVLSNKPTISDITDSSGRFYIDDSTLVGLAYRGISYSDSKYVNWSKSNSPRTDLYSYAIELPRDASQQAKYCIENGWILPKENYGKDFSNLKMGDIIFYSETPLSKGSIWGTKFMRVGHVALCSGKVNGKIMIYDVDEESKNVRSCELLSTDTDKISVIARPQLGVNASGFGGFDVIDNITANNFEGTSENFLEIGNISSEGYNTSNDYYARTKGYINVESVKGIRLEMRDINHVFSKICFYDENMAFISTNVINNTNYICQFPSNCKYIRYSIENTNNTNVLPQEINYSISYVLNESINTSPITNMTFKDFPKVTGKIENNYQLVSKLREILEEYETIYVYGGVGQKLSKSLIDNRKAAYSWFYTAERMKRYNEAIATGRTIWGFDCVNLIKSVLWGWKGDNSTSLGGAVYGSNGVQDVNADGCISICTDVKTTDWENMEIGEVVWLKGHIGVYVGNGMVIESSASGFKVELTACGNIGAINGLRTRNWTKHGKLPWITYLTECPYTKIPKNMEFKGDSQLSNIVPIPLVKDVTTNNIEIKQKLLDLGMGKAVGKSNYVGASQWDDLINEIAPQFGIDPYMVKMIIAAESAGQPTASASSVAGYGLMQAEQSVFFKGNVNPYTGTVNSGRYTLKYLDGTTEDVIISLETMNGNTDSGRRLQIKVGCNMVRENASKYYWNAIHTLVATNMGAGALNFICSKYVCEKYGWTLVNSGSLSKQNTLVQAKVQEVFATGDLGYLDYRKWYSETGHKLLNSGPGTPTNVEKYIQYYNSVDGQLPFFYKTEGEKVTLGDVTVTIPVELKDAMSNSILGYPNELVCSAPEGIPLGTKVLIQGTATEFDGKIFTVVNNHNEYNEYTIAIYIAKKDLVSQLDTKKGIVFVGDIVNDGKIVIATGNCNVRLGNSTDYEKIGVISEGFRATFLGEMSNKWKKIDFKGREGYSSGLYTTIKEV